MKKDTSKSTILVITLGFVSIFLLFKQQWALFTGLSVGFIGVFSARASIKIEWVWFKLAQVLSKIFPTIILSAIFYLILFPIAFCSKLFTKDPLLLKNTSKSTFRDVLEIDIKNNLEKPW